MGIRTLVPLDQEDDTISPKGSLVTIGGLQGTNSPEPTKSTRKAETNAKLQPRQKPSLKK